MEQYFTTKDIRERLGIPVQRHRVWVQEGWITPSVPSSGQGKSAKYSKQDIYGIALFRELIEGGFKREVAGEYINYLQSLDWALVKMTPFLGFIKITDPQGQEKIEPASFHFTPLVLKINVDGITSLMLTDNGHYGEPLEVNEIDDKIVWRNLFIVNFAQVKAEVDMIFK